MVSHDDGVNTSRILNNHGLSIGSMTFGRGEPWTVYSNSSMGFRLAPSSLTFGWPWTVLV